MFSSQSCDSKKVSHDILSLHPAVCYTSLVSPAFPGIIPLLFLHIYSLNWLSSCEGKFCVYFVMCDYVLICARSYNTVFILDEAFAYFVEESKTLKINVQLFQLRKGCWVPLSMQGWAIICRQSGSKLKTLVALVAWRKKDGSFLITCVITMML